MDDLRITLCSMGALGGSGFAIRRGHSLLHGKLAPRRHQPLRVRANRLRACSRNRVFRRASVTRVMLRGKPVYAGNMRPDNPRAASNRTNRQQHQLRRPFHRCSPPFSSITGMVCDTLQKNCGESLPPAQKEKLPSPIEGKDSSCHYAASDCEALFSRRCLRDLRK